MIKHKKKKKKTVNHSDRAEVGVTTELRSVLQNLNWGYYCDILRLAVCTVKHNVVRGVLLRRL